MPGGDKFVDTAKQALLYEFQQPDTLGAMLEQSPTNTLTNIKMSQVCLCLTMAQRAWRGKYKTLFGDLDQDLQRHLLSLEGYARLQAIEIHKAAPSGIPGFGPPDDKNKKGGLLGLIGR